MNPSPFSKVGFQMYCESLQVVDFTNVLINVCVKVF